MTNDQYLKNQNEDTKAYVEKLKKLLESEADESILLAFQLLESGGVPSGLLTHLYALSITYENYKIADAANALFEQNAPVELLEFAQNQWVYNDPLVAGEKILGDFLEETQGISHFDTPVLANLMLKFGAIGGAYCLRNKTAPVLDILQQIYNSEWLSLDNFNLEELPPEMGQLINIKHLMISGNQFRTIPDELQSLVHLERIYFDNTPLNDVSIQKLEKFFPKPMAHHYAELGKKAFQAEDYGKASKHMLKAIDLDASQADFWNTQGVILGRLGKKTEAIRFFNQVIKLNPQDTLAYSNKSHLLHLLGREEESLETANAGLKLFSQYPTISISWKAALYFRKGQALFHLNRYEESHQAYDQCIQAAPYFESAWFNKACTYARQHRKEEMLSHLSEAIQFNSKFKQEAPEDTDFEDYWHDEDFLALIKA